jgi:hypothetical protein
VQTFATSVLTGTTFIPIVTTVQVVRSLDVYLVSIVDIVRLANKDFILLVIFVDYMKVINAKDVVKVLKGVVYVTILLYVSPAIMTTFWILSIMYARIVLL